VIPFSKIKDFYTGLTEIHHLQTDKNKRIKALVKNKWVKTH
jgi:hypothetical protein